MTAGAMRGHIACTLLFLLMSVLGANADRRVALVIGNAAYESTAALTNPKNDATDMADALKAVGFEVILATDVDKRRMERAIVRFARLAQQADAALFYYAGHGIQYRGVNYLVPIDARLEDEFSLNFDLARVSDVVSALDGARGVKILILDACRNNPLADKLTRVTANRQLTIARGLARIDAVRGMVIAYATQPDQIAVDGNGRNSPFTSALLQQISQPGVEIGTLFRRVARQVHSATNGQQLPELSVSLFGEFFLNTRETDVQAWSKIRESARPADFSEFIRLYPNSALAADARARVAAIEQEAVERQQQQQLREQRERERIAREKAERERLQKEQERFLQAYAERERLARERLAREIAEREQRERQRLARELAERAEEREAEERKWREQVEQVRREREELARALAERERAEKERLARAERERRAQEERERAEKQRLADLQRAGTENEGLARERAERERAERERLARREERERLRELTELARREREQLAHQLAERERLAKQAADKQAPEKTPGPVALLTKPEPPAATKPDPETLARELQKELQRVGCYSGGIDGDWGPKSQAALRDFYRITGGSTASTDPGAQALAAVTARTTNVCPQTAKRPAPASPAPSVNRSAPADLTALRRRCGPQRDTAACQQLCRVAGGALPCAAARYRPGCQSGNIEACQKLCAAGGRGACRAARRLSGSGRGRWNR